MKMRKRITGVYSIDIELPRQDVAGSIPVSRS
jgi:hypothetical protein